MLFPQASPIAVPPLLIGATAGPRLCGPRAGPLLNSALPHLAGE